uniref:Uncharacterized protein n=1 Tax=Romanomermis culicivorax TaxID=13658 RepID=A0A915HWG9_ROMCU
MRKQETKKRTWKRKRDIIKWWTFSQGEMPPRGRYHHFLNGRVTSGANQKFAVVVTFGFESGNSSVKISLMIQNRQGILRLHQ